MKAATKQVLDQLLACGLERHEVSVQSQKDGSVSIFFFGSLERKLAMAPKLAGHFHVGIGEKNGVPVTMIVMVPGTRYPLPSVPIEYFPGIHHWEVVS